jgi:hypothetical protein
MYAMPDEDLILFASASQSHVRSSCHYSILLLDPYSVMFRLMFGSSDRDRYIQAGQAR